MATSDRALFAAGQGRRARPSTPRSACAISSTLADALTASRRASDRDGEVRDRGHSTRLRVSAPARMASRPPRGSRRQEHRVRPVARRAPRQSATRRVRRCCERHPSRERRSRRSENRLPSRPEPSRRDRIRAVRMSLRALRSTLNASSRSAAAALYAPTGSAFTASATLPGCHISRSAPFPRADAANPLCCTVMCASRSARLHPAHGVGRSRSSTVTDATTSTDASTARRWNGRRSSFVGIRI